MLNYSPTTISKYTVCK